MRTNNHVKEIKIHHKIAEVSVEINNHFNANKVKAYIRSALDKCLEEESITADVIHHALQKHHGDYYQTPGYYVRIFRKRANMTQTVLANALDIKQHHVSEMENNKRSIGKKMAKELGVILRADYHKFI